MRPLARIILAGVIAGALFAGLGGCSSLSCGASQDKLAQLKLGMSRDEASAVLGCPGKLVSESGKEPGRYTTVEWSGPDSLLLTRTYIVFLDGRLYTHSTEKRGGF